jgi:hypothetical protein
VLLDERLGNVVATSMILDLRGALSLPGETDIVVADPASKTLERVTIISYAGGSADDDAGYFFTVRTEKGEIFRRSAADLGLLESGDRVAFYALRHEGEVETSVA